MTTPTESHQGHVTLQAQNLQGADGSLTSSSGTYWKLITQSGHGSRHMYDDFDFSVWDADKYDYRYPSKEKVEQIFQKYNARSVGFYWPFIVVATPNPPKEVPLTIAGAIACFVLQDTHESGWRPSLPGGMAGYVNPRVKNPCPNMRLKKWKDPSPADIIEITNGLSEICNVQKLMFSYPFLVVELWEDGRSYARASLPGVVGPWSTTYHHGGNFWDQWSLAKGDRGVTNYLTTEDKYLSPGLRREGIYKAVACGPTGNVLEAPPKL